MKRTLVLTFFAATLALVFVCDTSDAQSRTGLFRIVTTPAAVGENERTSLASVQEAEVIFDAKSHTAINIERLSVPLFDGKMHEAFRTDFESRGSDDFTWRGKIKAGDVILAFKKGFVAGLIYSESDVYEIVPKGYKHILVKLDQSLFPECGGELRSDEKSPEKTNANAGAGTDSGDRVDVLVVYTTATKNILGGDAQAQAHAQAAIDAANTAYINSKIRMRVRMVHSQEFVYTETSSASTDLSNLRNNAGIQALRNTHNADLVAEISEAVGVCGIGYLMGSATGNPNNGFTVTNRTCAVGNITLGHEMGHNMGSHHNPENGGTATYPYGYGHYVNGFYRTVMSYVDPCTSGCARRTYFSNPAVEYLGFPTGILDARDNARSINNTADAIANYRYSGKSIMMTNYNSRDLLPRQIVRNLTWTSDNLTGNVRIDLSRDESTNWVTIVASTANDGTEPISVSGRTTKRARLRVVSLDSPWVSDSSVTNITLQ